MNNIELIKLLLKRLKKFSWLLLLLSLTVGAFFYYKAKQSVVTFTSKATVFPLNSTNDNSVASSTISNILGLSDAPKSFSGEASINIVELALSRRTREAVAVTKVPEFNNKTIASLLIEEWNRHTGFMQEDKYKMPTDSLGLVNAGSNLLKGGFTAKINKNGILEMNYTNTNAELVRIVSYSYVKNISDFYVELKKEKAEVDYAFSIKKADSLLNVLNGLDRRAIKLNETTFFTSDELKRYELPKTNLAQDKATVQSQYYYAVNNREAAAYKLQKETPIIKILDKPEPPYEITMRSAILFTIIGLVIGLIIGVILVSWKIISKYIEQEVNKALEKASGHKTGHEEVIVEEIKT